MFSDDLVYQTQFKKSCHEQENLINKINIKANFPQINKLSSIQTYKIMYIIIYVCVIPIL